MGECLLLADIVEKVFSGWRTKISSVFDFFNSIDAKRSFWDLLH
jgi:hypothetical protein